MLKLRRKATRHFVTLIEICMHLIRVNPGHICFVVKLIYQGRIYGEGAGSAHPSLR